MTDRYLLTAQKITDDVKFLSEFLKVEGVERVRSGKFPIKSETGLLFLRPVKITPIRLNERFYSVQRTYQVIFYHNRPDVLYDVMQDLTNKTLLTTKVEVGEGQYLTLDNPLSFSGIIESEDGQNEFVLGILETSVYVQSVEVDRELINEIEITVNQEKLDEGE